MNDTQDTNELIAQRRAKLTQLRQQGQAFPNDFRRTALAADLIAQYGEQDPEFLQQAKIQVKVAGRIVLRRLMGKASFVHLQDVTGRIQLYVRQDALPAGEYDAFLHWDLGDIIGASGELFKTKTGELSLHVSELQLLTKTLRPLPDKFHGLADQETCYRQRYLDLLANEETRQRFQLRSKIIEALRRFLTGHGFLEVETPMMHVIPGGASARPFITHHNALDMELYLRIAPELYLKRLVVGGFERVFEVNRNFRNEGLSIRHNPEFTMVEFYQAYADYHDLMNFTEAMLRDICQQVLQTTTIQYQGTSFDFGKPFQRLSVKQAIVQFNPQIQLADLEDREKLVAIAKQVGIEVKASDGLGKLQLEVFEETVEHKLIEPTFITQYPTEVSPLARRSDSDPSVTDRFELFIGGREIANGFSELNDPEDQAERFRQQVKDKEAGDLEAMHYDADYVTALEYGMPPTAGEGIGIDRLVMLLTDAASIRDVILFPHMRKVEQ